MAVTSKPISKQEYARRIAEINGILNSHFKISEKTKKELEEKVDRYMKIAYS